VPYSAPSTIALYKLIADPQPVRLPEQPAISSSLTKVIKRLLDKDASTRMTLQEVSSEQHIPSRRSSMTRNDRVL
jgi:hypothetical protein